MKYRIVIAFILLTSCFSKKPEKTGKEGIVLPDFSLQMIDSITYTNTKHFRTGKPSVIFLFSVYCPFCKSQLSKIQEDIVTLKNLNIYMITQESYGEMKQFYDANNLNKYPSIKVARDSAGFFGQFMSVKGIPFLALYDNEKKLVKAFSGATNTSSLKSVLDN